MRPIHALSLVAAVVALLIAGLFFVGRDPLPSDVAGPAVIETGTGTASAPARPETTLFAPEGGSEPAQRSVPVTTAATKSAPAGAGATDAKSFRLRGRVVGARGEPIARAIVYAANVGGMRDLPLDAIDPRSMPWVRRSETETGADGRFEVALDAQAGVRLAVRAAGFAPHDVEVGIAGAEHDVGDVALTPGVVLEGRVVDSLGRAVAGAELHRLGESASRFVFVTGARGPVVARTDAQGLFRVDQLASGPWRLLVTSADHPDKTETGEVDSPGTVVGDLVFTLEDGTEIEGRVVGAPPEMLANLWVRAQPRRGDAAEGVIVVGGETGGQPPLGSARTARVGPDGSFTLRGLKRDVNYRLSGREGEREFLARTRTAAVPARPGDRGVVLPYKPETALVFQVVDAGTGLPITELDVQAGYRWMMPLLDEASRPLRQFPDGRVRFGAFPGRPEGSDGERAQLLVEAAGYRAYERKDLTLVEGQDTDLGVIRLERAPVVVVTVVDDASGKPVAGARVSLEEKREESGTERRFAFNLGGGGEDTIIGGGSAQRARTDAEGKARVTSLPGKSATIRVRSGEHAPWQSEVLLLPLAEDVERTARVQVGGDVVVRVVDSKGEPVARASVEHEAPGASEETVFRPGGEAQDETDANGRVAFTHLAPGVHRFRLRDPASAAGPVRVMRGGRRGGAPMQGSGGGAPWTDVTVTERGEELLELVAPARGRLEGTIQEGGAPLAGATVRLAAQDDDMPALPMFGGGANQAKTSGKGRFEIDDVQEGEYRLTITHPSRAMPYETEVRIREGENDFDVDLAVAVIEGRVEGADGKPLAGIRVRAERGAGAEPDGNRRVTFTSMVIVNDGGDTSESTFGSAMPGGEAVLTDAEGRYRLRGVLPDVDLVVKASGKDYQAAESKTLRVHPDETKTGIDFALAMGGVIEATVVRADGRPGTSCMVRARPESPGAGEPQNAFTGGSGSVKLSGLAPGKWTVEVEPIGLAASDDSVAPAVQTVEVVVGKSTPVRFEIP